MTHQLCTILFAINILGPCAFVLANEWCFDQYITFNKELYIYPMFSNNNSNHTLRIYKL